MTSAELKIKLINFRINTLAKNDNWVYEKNKFDIFLDDLFLIIKKITKIMISNNMFKKLFFEISNSIKTLVDTLFDNKKFSKIENVSLDTSAVEKLEKKLDNHEQLFQSSLVENRSLKREISNLHQKIEKYLIDKETHKLSSDIGHNSTSQVDFYQEENLRIGSELFETKKKFEILKSEIEKYEQQRSNLISKINSVNDVLKDTNILTNVFDNNIEPKIKILDPRPSKNEKILDLNHEVKSIFSSK